MEPTYDNVMLDLETLGTKPGSVILSIGAVAFCTRTMQLGPKFKRTIIPRTCAEAGLVMDADTVLWWFKQSAEARLSIANANSVSLIHALQDFHNYLILLGVPADHIKVWGNGANFDNALLSAAYAAIKAPQPWKFWNDRCYRTVKNLHADIPYPRHEVAHDCLIDAEAQAYHLLQILAKYPLT